MFQIQNFCTFSKTAKTEEETEEYEFDSGLYAERTSTSAPLVSDQEQRICELEERLKRKEEECDRFRRQLDRERFCDSEVNWYLFIQSFSSYSLLWHFSTV